SDGNCTLRLYGLTAGFAALANADSMDFPLRANGFNFTKTSGVQTFQSGWASVDCSVEARVTITYSLYTASSQKISEATVFQNMGFNLARFVADQTEGARVGLALANQNPTDWNVTITINAIDGTVLGSVTVTIPARQSVSKFIDELVSGAQNGRG